MAGILVAQQVGSYTFSSLILDCHISEWTSQGYGMLQPE